MAEKIYLTWQQVHQDIKDVCDIIRQKGQFDKIIAISRGGLLPAGVIAYELNIRQTEVINISTYVDGQHLTLDKLDIVSEKIKADEQTLIIDDLSDSGQTFRLLRQQMPKGVFVSIYVKPKGQKEVDVYARALPDKWIVFPWDVEEN